MDEAYYTDAMRSAVASLDNKHGLELDIAQMEDESGPYLAILVEFDKYVRFGTDESVAREVAQYFADVHSTLRHTGARVTYMVLDNNDTHTVELENDEEVTID